MPLKVHGSVLLKSKNSNTNQSIIYTKTGQTGISKSSAGKSSPHSRSQHQQMIIQVLWGVCTLPCPLSRVQARVAYNWMMVEHYNTPTKAPNYTTGDLALMMDEVLMKWCWPLSCWPQPLHIRPTFTSLTLSRTETRPVTRQRYHKLGRCRVFWNIFQY